MAGAEDDGFLSRWSRLKRKSAVGAEQLPPVAEPGEQDAVQQAAVPDAEAPLDLPDIASLTRDSDFTVFMRPGVPEHLQRDALRALWKSDPIFSRQDGLTDYAEDFTKPEVVGAAVKTAWKIGRGFLDPPPEEATPDPGAEREVVDASDDEECSDSSKDA